MNIIIFRAIIYKLTRLQKLCVYICIIYTFNHVFTRVNTKITILDYINKHISHQFELFPSPTSHKRLSPILIPIYDKKVHESDAGGMNAGCIIENIAFSFF